LGVGVGVRGRVTKRHVHGHAPAARCPCGRVAYRHDRAQPCRELVSRAGTAAATVSTATVS
jgi:hypothetical protein